jgi:hypothetical protein
LSQRETEVDGFSILNGGGLIGVIGFELEGVKLLLVPTVGFAEGADPTRGLVVVVVGLGELGDDMKCTLFFGYGEIGAPRIEVVVFSYEPNI